MIKMTMDHQPNVETSTKCSEAEVTAPGLALVAAATIVAAAGASEGVEVALVAAAEVLEAAGVALEATVEAGLVAASTTEAAEVSIVAAALEGVVVEEDLVAVVALATEEDMGGVAIRIMLNVYYVYVTVL